MEVYFITFTADSSFRLGRKAWVAHALTTVTSISVPQYFFSPEL